MAGEQPPDCTADSGTPRPCGMRSNASDPLSCAGHRQLASARQDLRFWPSTNGTGGRFLGKCARGRKSGPTWPARAHRASLAQAEPGARDRNTAPLLHQSRNTVTPNSASADFCAVALRSPHRVEFRCAGSHYKSKVVWSEMPSNFLQSVYTAIKIADIGTYRCGTSQPNDGGSPGFMMCISNSHFCSDRVAYRQCFGLVLRQ